VRVRHDLLAAAAGLARGGGVGPGARRAAGPDARGRGDRLVAGGGGLLLQPLEKGGAGTGPSPVDRGKAGTKRFVLVDRNGTPLALTLAPANRNDAVELPAVLDAVPPVRGRPGRPRRRPDKLHADKGFDHRRCRDDCRRRGIRPRIARRGIERGDRLGRHRWVAERTLAWFGGFRRIVTRYERREDIHLGLHKLAMCVTTYRQWRRFC
jgi:transposase